MNKLKKYSNEIISYNKNNGRPCTNLKEDCFTLNKINIKECRNCGESNNLNWSYCKVCGKSLEIIDNNNGNASFFIKNLPVQKILVTSFLSLVLLFSISLMLSHLIRSNNNAILSSINIGNIMLALNLGEISLFGQSIVNEYSTNISLGVIIFLIFPVVSLAIPNIIFLKKEAKTSSQAIIYSILVSLLYSVGLIIIAMLSTTTLNLFESSGFGYQVIFGYTVKSITIRSLVISFITSFIILYNRNLNQINIIIDLFNLSLKVILRLLIIISIVLLVLKVFNVNYIYEFGGVIFKGNSNFGILLSQLAVYTFALANGAILKINNSVISIMSTNILGNLYIILFVVSLIVALVLILTGCKIKNRYGSHGVKYIFIFSFLYALLMGMISKLSSVHIDSSVGILSNNASLSIAIDTISIIIKSFIYCIAMSFIGFKLNITEKINEEE